MNEVLFIPFYLSLSISDISYNCKIINSGRIREKRNDTPKLPSLLHMLPSFLSSCYSIFDVIVSSLFFLVIFVNLSFSGGHTVTAA